MKKAKATLTDGSPATLADRPVRTTLIHTGTPDAAGCGQYTKLSFAQAENYARDPQHCATAYCAACADHFPNEHFTWEGTTEIVGS